MITLDTAAEVDWGVSVALHPCAACARAVFFELLFVVLIAFVVDNTNGKQSPPIAHDSSPSLCTNTLPLQTRGGTVCAAVVSRLRPKLRERSDRLSLARTRRAPEKQIKSGNYRLHQSKIIGVRYIRNNIFQNSSGFIILHNRILGSSSFTTFNPTKYNPYSRKNGKASQFRNPRAARRAHQG